MYEKATRLNQTARHKGGPQKLLHMLQMRLPESVKET